MLFFMIGAGGRALAPVTAQRIKRQEMSGLEATHTACEPLPRGDRASERENCES